MLPSICLIITRFHTLHQVLFNIILFYNYICIISYYASLFELKPLVVGEFSTATLTCFGSAASYGVAISVVIYPSSLKWLKLPYSGWLAMGLENPVTPGSVGSFVSSKRLNFSLVLLETYVP
jgi:hypothetical protein